MHNKNIDKFVRKLIKENLDKNKRINDLYSSLTIKDGMVKLWHYSNVDFDDVIKPANQNPHSANEYKVWGKSRVFFYGVEDGYKKDSIGNFKYIYTTYHPLNKMYPIFINPKDYKTKGEHKYQSLYNQSTEDGYDSFIYGLGGDTSKPNRSTFWW